MGFFSRLAQGLKNTKKSFIEKLKYVFKIRLTLSVLNYNILI